MGHFCPPGSGSTDLIESGSGSETLLYMSVVIRLVKCYLGCLETPIISAVFIGLFCCVLRCTILSFLCCVVCRVPGTCVVLQKDKAVKGYIWQIWQLFFAASPPPPPSSLTGKIPFPVSLTSFFLACQFLWKVHQLADELDLSLSLSPLSLSLPLSPHFPSLPFSFPLSFLPLPLFLLLTMFLSIFLSIHYCRLLI